MFFCVSADIVLPIITGSVTEILGKEGFKYFEILRLVLLYIALLILSVICTYIQAIVLQKTGQRIVSQIREDVFNNIESLTHNQ